MTDSVFTLEEAHLNFAKAANGLVWRLLEQAPRTPDDDDAMLRAAHTSLFHWLQVGRPVHAQRGEWLLAHVHAALKNPPACLHHALRCLALTEAHPAEMQDFDRAYALEALARAHALVGDLAAARLHHARAAEAGAAIANDEDRGIFTTDFAGGDWFGLLP